MGAVMEPSPVVHFGPFTFDRARMVLQRNDQPIPIGGRGAAILAALADAGGAVVSRDALIDAVWPDLIVEERNLTVQIATLRKAMGDLPNGHDPISTVARVGYRLICDNPVPATIAALRPSVAVLPFANLTAEPELAFFADGMTEDIIAALSRFRTLAVVARGATVGLQNRTAAVALGVSYVVEGSVRREGRRLRIGVRLTDTAGQVLWADRFEDELGGVFEMQDRITAAVVRVAEPRISGAEVERSRRKHPENLDAYDHFIQGLACFHGTSTPFGRNHAIVHHFDRAVALDPSFPQALAYAGMAHEWRSMLDLAADQASEFAITLDLCDRAAAMAVDDALVLAMAALVQHGLRDDGEGGLALASRAVALNPHSHDVVDFAATVHMLRDRTEAASEMFQHCLRLAPGSPQAASSISSIAFCHMNAGRYADAIAWETRAQALQPNADFGLVLLIAAQAMDGRADEARRNLDRLLAERPGATIAKLLHSVAPGSRAGFRKAWTEGLRRAGMPD